MSFEIGSAYISVFPKIASGFGRDIKAAFAGADTAGADAGKGAGSAFGAHLKALLGAQVISKVVSGAASVIKAGLAGGMSRLMGVEEAQAKMRGLGHSAEVAASVVKQAQKAVDGTIYTTAEASTVAASALAAGIKPGAELDRVLGSVANAASAAGIGMDEMGSVYTKVASIGKAQNDSLQQVADRGIPIYQALADQFGVTTEEVFKLASAGKISFADFEQAMTSATGTVAKEMGQTLSGAITNTKSAVNKLGESLLGGIFPALTPLFLGLREGLKGLQAPAKALGDTLGAWLAPKIETLGKHLANLPQIFAQVGEKVSTISSRIQDALSGLGDGPMVGLGDKFRAAFSVAGDAVQAFVAGLGGVDAVRQIFLNLIPAITGPIGVVRAALLQVFRSGGGGIDFVGFASTVGTALQPVLVALGDLVQMVTGQLAGALGALIPIAMEIGGAVLSLASSLVSGLAPVLTNLVATLLPMITQLVAAIVPAIMAIVSALAPLVTQLIGQVAPVIMNLVSAVLPPVVSIIGTVVDAVGGIVTALAPVVSALLSLLVPILTDLVSTLIPPLAGVIADVANLLSSVVVPIITTVVEVLSAILVPAIEVLAPIVQTVFSFIGSTISNVLGVVSGIIKVVTGVIKGDWDLVWNGIVQVFTSVWNQILNIGKTGTDLILGLLKTAWDTLTATTGAVFNGLVSFMTGIPGQIMAALAGLAGLASMSAQWFLGFVSGARQKLGEAVELARSIPSKVISALGNLGGLLVNSGRAMLDGLARGIRQGFSRAVSEVSSGLANLRSFFPFSPAKKGPFSGKGYTSFSGRKLMEDFGVGISKGAQATLAAADRAMGQLNGKLSAKSKKSAQDSVKAGDKLVKGYQDVVKKLVTTQVNMTTALREQGRTLWAGSAKQADDVLKGWIKEVQRASTPVTNALANFIQAERAKLVALQQQREQIAKKLKDANKTLADQIKAKAAYGQGLFGKLFDTSALLKEGATAADMIKGLRDQVKATAKFRRDLAALSKMGLDKDLLDQFAQAGTDSGGAAAAALLAGGKQAVSEVNKLQGQLARESQSVANSMSSRMYDAGINATKGLIAGLMKQQNEVARAAGQLANKIAATIKKELKIKSPSRVTGELGAFTGRGLWEGILGEESAVARAANRLASAAIPAISPINAAPGQEPTQQPRPSLGSVMQNIRVEVPRDAFRDASTFLRFIAGLDRYAHQAGGMR